MKKEKPTMTRKSYIKLYMQNRRFEAGKKKIRKHALAICNLTQGVIKVGKNKNQ